MATLSKLKDSKLAPRQAATPSTRSRKLPLSLVQNLSTEQKAGQPVAAAKAKAHFSELLAQVEHGGKPILISKRGKVVAQLVPAPEALKVSNFDRVFGSMKGTGRITGDIVSPDWDAWGPEWR